MEFLAFLLTIVAISLSGVMAPGPVTAATLAAGARNRYAGAWICAGHVAVELPLILVLVGGLGALLESQRVRAGIGWVGGLALLWMGLKLLASLRRTDTDSMVSVEHHPFWIGIVLSGANPYFLLWWATVGLALTTRAMQFGLLALGLFVLLHWLCDFVWLQVLSFAGFRGSRALGSRSQRLVTAVCALALFGFGLKFIYDASLGLTAPAVSAHRRSADPPIGRDRGRRRVPRGPQTDRYIFRLSSVCKR